MHHVVIGDGATAAGFAARARLGSGDRLTIIGPRSAPGHFGRGLAYADPGPNALWRDLYLLNSPSGAVVQAFPDWVRANWSAIAPRLMALPGWMTFNAEALAADDIEAVAMPRAIMGDYLSEVAETALTRHAARSVQIDRVPHRVLSIGQQDTGFRITLDSGQIRDVDRIDLAPGAAPPAQFSVGGPAVFSNLYGFEAGILAALRPGVTVTAIGANATMLDLMRLIDAAPDGKDVELQVISPSGLLPEPLIPRRPRMVPVKPQLTGQHDTADAFIAMLRNEVAQHRRAGAAMAELRAGFRLSIDAAKLARLVPNGAERRRVPALAERLFRRGNHDSLAAFEEGRRRGRITMVRGHVETVEPGPTLQLINADGHTSLPTDVVVNCSGPGSGRFDKLTESLIAAGAIDATVEGLVTGAGFSTNWPGLRYLSPAVVDIGGQVDLFPLYDVARLFGWLEAALGPSI